MTSSRREFIRNMGAGLAGVNVAAANLACAGGGGGSSGGESERLLEPNPDHVDPAPIGYDRLPLEWHKRTTQRLKERVSSLGVDAILLSSDQNQVYYTGCFRHSGERSTWVLFPVEEQDTVYWYSPGIDRDLITSWWSTENEYYFGYPHAEGGFPNRGQVVQGPSVDLFEWMLTGLGRRGLRGKTIGYDRTLTPAELRTVRRILPGTRFVDIGAACLQMQIIKTPEELALLQRAYRYFDKIHAFARDYILERGTDATDFELGQALQAYGINLLMQDVRRDGRPHTAVGIESTSNYVRAGVASAYPHPNQFFHQKIARGQTVYVNTDIKLGGFGGECYRNYLIGPWTPAQEKMWEVVAESVRIQEEESAAGAVCSEIARRIHEHQVRNGMQDFIYHRPGHGQGQFYVGHQPPFIALGDQTVLQENMTFSMEPGLYDSANGIGINPSDNLRVTATKGVRFSSVPFSKEWSFLEI
ncbi:MAG: aminopeptidase P family protein [Gemmatimonadetes bacterium]|nr:aminopeptidase P family protein [Gemmatimonadota bacterium]